MVRLPCSKRKGLLRFLSRLNFAGGSQGWSNSGEPGTSGLLEADCNGYRSSSTCSGRSRSSRSRLGQKGGDAESLATWSLLHNSATLCSRGYRSLPSRGSTPAAVGPAARRRCVRRHIGARGRRRTQQPRLDATRERSGVNEVGWRCSGWHQSRGFVPMRLWLQQLQELRRLLLLSLWIGRLLSAGDRRFPHYLLAEGWAHAPQKFMP